jgi:hypothetical protein
MTRPDFAALDAETWLIKRLGEHGAAVFDGVTDREHRAYRVRKAILAHNLRAVIVGRGKDGKSKTYAQAFEVVYGQKLEGPVHG